jgi:hypothetical protein
VIVFVLAALLTGCASSGKYYWGSYEDSMYKSYKDPTKAAELTAELNDIITSSEKSNKPVAPGIYAEYGFLLHQQGKSKEAIPYFEKEKAHWPESTSLMNSMIEVASKTHVATTK